jgi:hypothetical protein
MYGFSLLYMSALACNYWCFSIMHTAGLLNAHPLSGSCAPSFEGWTGKHVDIGDCRVFGSRTHAVIQCLVLQTHSGTYLGIQGTPHTVMLEDDQRPLHYTTHHVMVDELQYDLAMDKCNPASQFMSSQLVDTDHCGNILRELDPQT